MYRDEKRKPIVQKGETPTLVGNLGYLNSIICPNCGKYLTAYYDADMSREWYIADDWNYCGRCGQHLDLDEYKRFGKDIVFEDEQMETQTKTQNSNLTFEKDECAKEYEELGLKELKELIEADRKTEPTISKMEQVDKDINVRSKDEPQTEKGGCTNCDGKDLCNNAFTEISQYCGAYEPQNGYQTFNGTSVYVSRLDDEPQTDCPWK